MNVTEFSNEFDVLYNNIMSNAAPPVDEYEKSVFLTKAQEEVVKNHFEPAGNKYGKGFDDSSKRQIDFSAIIKVQECTEGDSSSLTLDSRAKIYNFPDDMFIPLNEVITTDRGVKQVIPVSYLDYTRLMSRPYKEPLKYQVWRIITTPDSVSTVEIIPHTGDIISNYRVRYVKRPAPIITVDLSTEYPGVTIEGLDTISECQLNPMIHPEILQRAVELAKEAYEGNLQTKVELGQRSE